MLSGLKSLLGSLTDLAGDGADDAREEAEKERLAVAALLVHAATVDGRMDESEQEVLRDLLERHYRIGSSDSKALLAEARSREAESVEIYKFTRVIQTTLSQEERQAIIRLMWRVAVADGEIHEFESNLVWRTAELIGVSTRDRVELRQDVLAEAEKSRKHDG